MAIFSFFGPYLNHLKMIFIPGLYNEYSHQAHLIASKELILAVFAHIE